MSGVAVRLTGFMSGTATHESWSHWDVTKEGVLHLKDERLSTWATFAPGQWSYVYDINVTPQITNDAYPPPLPYDPPEEDQP